MVARDRNRKIIMVGPAACGKSVLANLFGDQADLTKIPYRPTIGVRILETDVSPEKLEPHNSRAIFGRSANETYKIAIQGGARQHCYRLEACATRDNDIVVKAVPEITFPRSLAIQLWDVGGGKENQQFWNACLYGADACIIVYDGDKSGQEKELEFLLYYFTQRPESAILRPISLSKVLCIATHKTRSRSLSTASGLPPDFNGKITEVHHSYEDEPTVLKSHFTRFVNEISENKL